MNGRPVRPPHPAAAHTEAGGRVASPTPTQLLLAGLRPLPGLWHPVPLSCSTLQLPKTSEENSASSTFLLLHVLLPAAGTLHF